MNFAAHLKFVLFLLVMLLSALSMQAQQKEYCSLSGSVFVVQQRERAFFRVYIEPNETFADMNVVKMENKLFADKPGLWHFAEALAQADFTIYLEEERSLADFSIHFGEVESFAGCK